MAGNVIYDKSYEFAVRVVGLYRYLLREHREYILSKQVLRSGTAIGALVREAKFAQSRADFINKMSIALKEANETSCWLDLLYDTDYINQKMHQDINSDINELISLLVTIVKSSKNNS